MRSRLEFGRAIETLRTSKALTREELARLARISHSYLSEIERGLKRPSADIVARVARALGMKGGTFLNYVEELSAPLPDEDRPVPAVQMPLRRGRALPLFTAEQAQSGRAGARDGSRESEELATSEITVIARRLGPEDRRALLQMARHLLRRR
jgi:transcriptional regulator with XRE-family HTH domain